MRELLQQERRDYDGELRSLGLTIAGTARTNKVG